MLEVNAKPPCQSTGLPLWEWAESSFFNALILCNTPSITVQKKSSLTIDTSLKPLQLSLTLHKTIAPVIAPYLWINGHRSLIVLILTLSPSHPHTVGLPVVSCDFSNTHLVVINELHLQLSFPSCCMNSQCSRHRVPFFSSAYQNQCCCQAHSSLWHFIPDATHILHLQ